MDNDLNAQRDEVIARMADPECVANLMNDGFSTTRKIGEPVAVRLPVRSAWADRLTAHWSEGKQLGEYFIDQSGNITPITDRG